MDYIGKKVVHVTYGEGKISSFDGLTISVQFDNDSKTRLFVYPSCFQSYLRFKNAADAEQTTKTMREHEAHKKSEQLRRIDNTLNQIRSKAGNGRSGISVNTFSSANQFFSYYRCLLEGEIRFLRTTGGKRMKLYNGTLIEVSSGTYRYLFESEEELNLPDGTQVTIWKDRASYLGSIISCEDYSVCFSTRENLGSNIFQIEISAEPWRLLEALIDRLGELEQNHNDIVHSLILDGYANIDYSNHKITTGQEDALKMACSNPITFIWGPPGAGKTETLARIALKHIDRGNRVLMLSYSNVSVDGALWRVFKKREHIAPGTLIRYGYPKDKMILEHEYLTAHQFAIRQHPEQQEYQKKLNDEKKRCRKASPRYIQIERELTQIKKKLAEDEKQAVLDARFVATTVSKAVIDKTIYQSDFDVIIFDEASMAYIPQIIFSAGLATKHFICMGDFRQLPPIVQSEEGAPLVTDIFSYCGITKAVDEQVAHRWLCMLDTQYRMHPVISDYASLMMYQGLLNTANQIKADRNKISSCAPLSKMPIAVVDLSGMLSVCTKTADGSRINILSALITLILALKSAESHDVGIITPYRAQARLIHSMLRDIDLPQSGHNIVCATVYQFQGSEKDVIFFDAVDCYRMTHPGVLLTETNNNSANRLFNVALTRARGKFVAVTNVDYMMNKNLSAKLMFGNLLHKYRYSEVTHIKTTIIDFN